MAVYVNGVEQIGDHINQFILYKLKNEIGLVKRVKEDNSGVFAWFHTGDTASSISRDQYEFIGGWSELFDHKRKHGEPSNGNEVVKHLERLQNVRSKELAYIIHEDVEDPSTCKMHGEDECVYSYVYDKKTKMLIEARSVGQHWGGVLILITYMLGIRDDIKQLSDFYSSATMGSYGPEIDLDKLDAYIKDDIEMVGADWWTRNRSDEVIAETKKYREKYGVGK